MSDTGSKSAPRIYTKTGDSGQTSLVGGTRVSKADARLDAYGTIDELNSVIGLVVADATEDLKTAEAHPDRTHVLESDKITTLLHEVQNRLFDIGSHLACESDEMRARLPALTELDVQVLEKEIDRYTAALKPLRNFILPGGCRSAAGAHLARTVCRRAERLCVALALTSNHQHVSADSVLVRYLNRLSDYLFVLARHLNRLQAVDEPIWGKPK